MFAAAKMGSILVLEKQKKVHWNYWNRQRKKTSKKHVFIIRNVKILLRGLTSKNIKIYTMESLILAQDER